MRIPKIFQNVDLENQAKLGNNLGRDVIPIQYSPFAVVAMRAQYTEESIRLWEWVFYSAGGPLFLFMDVQTGDYLLAENILDRAKCINRVADRYGDIVWSEIEFTIF